MRELSDPVVELFSCTADTKLIALKVLPRLPGMEEGPTAGGSANPYLARLGGVDLAAVRQEHHHLRRHHHSAD